MRQKPLIKRDMENKTNELCVKMPMFGHGTSGGSKAGARCRRLENLRPSGRGGCFEPVGQPERYGVPSGSVPLGRFAAYGADAVLFASGKGLSLRRPGTPAPLLSADNVLPGDVLCTMRGESDATLVMTDKGAVEIGVGDELTVRNLRTDYPAVTMRGKDGVTITAQVGARRLGTLYDSNAALAARDAEAVVGDLEKAYLELSSRASSAGALLQPCLVRYRLRDASGHELFVSPTVLAGHSTGAQCAGPVAIYSHDRQTLNGYTLSASCWALEACFPGTEGMDDVASCEIYASPLFHPYHPDGKAEVSLGRGSDSSAPFLYASLPGAECGLGTSYRGNARRLLMNAVARMDAIEERVAVVYRPFSEGNRTVTVDYAAPGDASVVSRGLHKALSQPVRRAGRLEALLSRPHAFSARCCAAEARTVAWGDLTVMPYGGYSPAVFAVSTSDRPWQSVTVVRFSDGRGVVRLDGGESGAPVQFGPVLSYPLPDATELIINVTSGGVTRSQTFALRPDVSGRKAVYISDGMLPFELSTLGVTTHKVKGADERLADAVAFAPTDDPLAVDAVTRTPGGAVRALVACRGRDQSWEFGRCRFACGSEGGVYSFVLSPERRSLSVRKILPQGVSRGDAMVSGGNGDVFVLAGDGAGTERSLLRLPVNGVIESLSAKCAYQSLAYNFRDGELWAIGDDGSAEIFCRDYGWNSYRRTDVDVADIVTADGEPFALCGTAVAALCHEKPYGALPVALELELEPDRLDLVKLSRVSVRMSCAKIDGNIRVGGFGPGRDRVWPMAGLRVSGACPGPLGFGLVSRRCRALVVGFAGTVSDDFIFHS